MCMWTNLGSCWKLTQQVWNGACRMWLKMTKLSEVNHFILSKQGLEKQAAIHLRVPLLLLLTRVWQQSCPKEAPNPVSWKSPSNSCLTLYPVNMFPSGPTSLPQLSDKVPLRSGVRGQNILPGVHTFYCFALKPVAQSGLSWNQLWLGNCIGFFNLRLQPWYCKEYHCPFFLSLFNLWGHVQSAKVDEFHPSLYCPSTFCLGLHSNLETFWKTEVQSAISTSV